MSFLEIENITKTYPGADTPCIEDMSISVEKGEIVVVLGPSGCGKSTLLKMISGLEKQDCGSVVIDNEDISDVEPEKRPVSMVFQKAYLFRNMTVADNISYSPRVTGKMKRYDYEKRVEKMLELVELSGYGDRPSTSLSGGQEQRVSLARALITEPKVLLLDEPFSALDAELRISLRAKLKEICKKIGQTVIFVTHDQQEAVAIADRIMLMMGGKIIQDGRPDDFYHRPVSRKSAEFFGWKNSILATQKGRTVECQLGTFELDVEPQDRMVNLMIHPQAAICTPGGEFLTMVKKATYLGTISDYTVECKGVELEIEVSCRNMHLVGEPIRFNLDRSMMYPTPVEKRTPKPKKSKIQKGFLDSFKDTVSDIFSKKEKK